MILPMTDLAVRPIRVAVDTGGTFTDLVVEVEDGSFLLFKSPTVPSDPIEGVLNVLELAARETGSTLDVFLAPCRLFIHGTTRAINAILTSTTAKTALLVTEGHPDILLFREGGRTDIFNWTRDYPPPYISADATYEIPERVGSRGEVVRPLDSSVVLDVLREIRSRDIEAIAVCLLWSVVNPEHEEEIANLIENHAAELPYTLSHQLNPSLREYRRASATAIDASLKPVMSEYLGQLQERLREAGLSSDSRVLVVTSSGGVLDAGDVAKRPIYSVGSGPAMAPVAGRFYAETDAGSDTAVVADTGGTSYDVSLVRRGRIPVTRETWLGPVFSGHMTGFPSIDVRSIGAGGGSIASVDGGGLLRVGPESAGANPGPACYARGGDRPTVTDAALLLGYLDAEYFLGGQIPLDGDAAAEALDRHVAHKLALTIDEAAAAVLRIVTESMARAIEEITIKQGVDPREAVLVGGGGAAGLNSLAIARRLGCPKVVIPATGATLSAAGALMSDLTHDYAATLYVRTTKFPSDRVNALLATLQESAATFFMGPGRDSIKQSVEFIVEARYPNQMWEIEVPLKRPSFTSPSDIRELEEDFHAMHEEIFAVSDRDSHVEILTWHARPRCVLSHVKPEVRTLASMRPKSRHTRRRAIFIPGEGRVAADVWSIDDLPLESIVHGPAIVESPITSIVVDGMAGVSRSRNGSVVILPSATNQRAHISTIDATVGGQGA
jgi:N-methylhydantoinase A